MAAQRMRPLSEVERGSLRVFLDSMRGGSRAVAARCGVSRECLRSALAGGMVQAAKRERLFAAMGGAT